MGQQKFQTFIELKKGTYGKQSSDAPKKQAVPNNEPSPEKVDNEVQPSVSDKSEDVSGNTDQSSKKTNTLSGDGNANHATADVKKTADIDYVASAHSNNSVENKDINDNVIKYHLDDTNNNSTSDNNEKHSDNSVLLDSSPVAFDDNNIGDDKDDDALKNDIDKMKNKIEKLRAELDESDKETYENILHSDSLRQEYEKNKRECEQKIASLKEENKNLKEKLGLTNSISVKDILKKIEEATAENNKRKKDLNDLKLERQRLADKDLKIDLQIKELDSILH